MLSPALSTAICLTAYFLVVTGFCLRKLRGASPWRRLLSLLFPASQLCLVLFALGAAAVHAAPVAPIVAIAVLGVACGPVDALLFSALREACFRAQAAEQVRQLEGQLATQELLLERSAHERQEADLIGQRVREQLLAAEADLRAQRAAEAGASLDRAIDAIGGGQARFCAHPAVDALVRLKAADARELGVRFSAQLNVPLDLALPSAEVCAVFSNLIDNALAACRPVAQEKRYVSVTARLWGRYFVLDVENSCRSCDSAYAAAAPLTPAAPVAPGVPAVPNMRALHGWGRGIVGNIAGRHNGQVSVEDEQSRYHVRVILQIEGGDAR